MSLNTVSTDLIPFVTSNSSVCTHCLKQETRRDKARGGGGGGGEFDVLRDGDFVLQPPSVNTHLRSLPKEGTRPSGKENRKGTKILLKFFFCTLSAPSL